MPIVLASVRGFNTLGSMRTGFLLYSDNGAATIARIAIIEGPIPPARPLYPPAHGASSLRPTQPRTIVGSASSGTSE